MYELINVSKSYGKNQIFTNLNFTIESKKFTGIFGESGSGKTTLVSILGMLDQKYTGNYIFNGINITQLGDRELSTLRKEKIGFLFQESYLINEITVFDNLLLNVLDKENKQLINLFSLSLYNIFSSPKSLRVPLPLIYVVTLLSNKNIKLNNNT